MPDRPFEGEPYALALGKLKANFLSLEFALRATLYDLESAPQFEQGQDILSLPVGAELPANALTDWRSLGQLIAAFNRFAPEYAVDEELVSVRDAFAHGRILADTLDSPYHLIRYSKPVNGFVHVEANQVLTQDWIAGQVRLTADSIQRVLRARATYNPGAFQ